MNLWGELLEVGKMGGLVSIVDYQETISRNPLQKSYSCRKELKDDEFESSPKI